MPVDTILDSLLFLLQDEVSYTVLHLPLVNGALVVCQGGEFDTSRKEINAQEYKDAIVVSIPLTWTVR